LKHFILFRMLKVFHTVTLLVRIISGDTKLELLHKNHIWGEYGGRGEGH